MKKEKILFFMFIFTIVTSIVFAQESDYSDLFDEETSKDLTEGSARDRSPSDTGSGSLEPDFTLSLSGNHSFIFRAPVMPDYLNFDGAIKAPQFWNDLGVEISYKFLKVVSHWELDLIVNQSGDVTQFLSAYPLENSIIISPWKFKFGAGFQYFTWGTADTLNPTDNINARDYTMGPNFEKMSILSGFISFAPVNFFSIEAIYVPFAAETIYPIDFVGYIEEPIKEINPAAEVSTILPKFDPSSFKLGGKASFYFQYADFSFSYLYDLDPFYTPRFSTTKQVTGVTPDAYIFMPESVDLVRNRLHRIGADFKTTVDRFGIWAEICYTMTEDYTFSDYTQRNPQLEWVAGFDFNYGYDNQFYFSFQYTGRFAFLYDDTYDSDYSSSTIITGEELPFQQGKDESYYSKYYYRQTVNQLGNIREALMQGVVLKMDFPVTVNSITLKPGFATAYYLPLIYDHTNVTRYGSLYVNPEFSVSPMESLTFAVGADLFFSWVKKKGKDTVEIDYLDTLGVYNPSSSVYFMVKYNWGFNLSK